MQQVYRIVLGSDVDPQAPFYEVGVDSIDLLRLHAELQRALGVSFSTSAMFEHPSMATLIRYLDAIDSEPRSSAEPAERPAFG